VGESICTSFIVFKYFLSFFQLLSFSDLQNVNITLRILFRPIPDQLPRIYTILGVDYDERVLPSITTEVLKAVVVRYLHYFFGVTVNFFHSLKILDDFDTIILKGK
jgi:hypothetical protein